MKNDVFFSIIIPTFNRGYLIKNTINSLLKQDYTNYEIVVVDDGSTDNTKEIVDSLKNDKINYFFKKNGERGAARNYGLYKSRGNYINFFDSDDEAMPNHLSTANNLIMKTGLNIIHLGHNIKKINKQILNNPIGDLSIKMMYGNIMLPISTFVSRKLALKIKFSENRDLSGSEDYLFWLKIIAYQKILGFPNVTSNLIIHNKRSMNAFDGDKNYIRQKVFLRELQADKKFIEKFNKYINVIKASSYLLIALDYSMEKKIYKCFKLLIYSILLAPSFIFSKRPYAILKNLFYFQK